MHNLQLKAKGISVLAGGGAGLSKAEEGLEYFLRQIGTVRFHEYD
jgi:hypothetical protein